MPIKPADYEIMRSWLGHMRPKVFPSDLLNAQNDPVTVLDGIAATSAEKARSGLATAIGDLVEFTSDWSEAEVSRCDNELAQSGLPTLTQVRALHSRVVQRAVRRGRIKNDEEFYAVRNALGQTEAARVSLWPLLEAYEIHHPKK